MNSLLKKISLGVLGLASCAIALNTSNVVAQAANTNLFLTVSGGIITIGAPTSGTIGTVTVATSATPISYTFGVGNEFWLQDLKGTDQGYYTTIQSSSFSGATIASNALATIAATNVKMSVTSNTTIGTTPLTGNANAGVKANVANTFATLTAINAPLTFIERKNGVNFGKVGKYGILPTIQVTVPAFTPVDAYTAIVTYTLYDVTNP